MDSVSIDSQSGLVYGLSVSMDSQSGLVYGLC